MWNKKNYFNKIRIKRQDMNIKRFNSIMFKVVGVVLAIGLIVNIIGYYYVLKVGIDLLDKLIK